MGLELGLGLLSTIILTDWRGIRAFSPGEPAEESRVTRLPGDVQVVTAGLRLTDI